MAAPETLLDLYLHLARAAHEQAQPTQRDKFLVLAAATAHQAGYRPVADRCVARVLRHSPGHMLGKFPNAATALDSAELTDLCKQLRRLYPFEKAEYLLQKACASGYAGDHGFTEVWPASGLPATLPAAVAEADPFDSDPADGPATIRPAVQKALAALERKRRTGAPSAAPRAKSVLSAQRGQARTSERRRHLSWAAFWILTAGMVGAVAIVCSAAPLFLRSL